MKKIIFVILLAGGMTTTALADKKHDLSAQNNLMYQDNFQESIVSHSGRTDKTGCHRDRKRGGRHCH